MQKIGQFKNAYLKFAFLLLINFHFKIACIFETASFGLSKETRIVISLNSEIQGSSLTSEFFIKQYFAIPGENTSGYFWMNISYFEELQIF